jgi:hypothetical protein
VVNNDDGQAFTEDNFLDDLPKHFDLSKSSKQSSKVSSLPATTGPVLHSAQKIIDSNITSEEYRSTASAEVISNSRIDYVALTSVKIASNSVSPALNDNNSNQQQQVDLFNLFTLPLSKVHRKKN